MQGPYNKCMRKENAYWGHGRRMKKDNQNDIKHLYSNHWQLQRAPTGGLQNINKVMNYFANKTSGKQEAVSI